MDNNWGDEWYGAMIAKGHTPRMTNYGDDRYIDQFVVNGDFCNGPGCLTCEWSCCMHCGSIDKIPECKIKKLSGDSLNDLVDVEMDNGILTIDIKSKLVKNSRIEEIHIEIDGKPIYTNVRLK